MSAPSAHDLLTRHDFGVSKPFPNDPKRPSWDHEIWWLRMLTFLPARGQVSWHMPELTFQDPSFSESGSFVLCHSTDTCLEAGAWQEVSLSVPPASGCASTQLCFQNGRAELHSSQGHGAGKRHSQGSPWIPLGARGSVHACLPPPAAELMLSNTEVAPSQNTPSSGLTGSANPTRPFESLQLCLLWTPTACCSVSKWH